MRTALGIWMLLVAVAGLAGCSAHRRLAAYRVVQKDEGVMLFPPRVPERQGSETRFVYRTPAEVEDCSGDHSGIQLRKRKGAIAVTVRSDEAAKRPAGWLLPWSASMEERRCVPEGEGLQLARLVAEAMPLNISRGQDPLRVKATVTGYSDLEIGSKLRVVGPVFKPGTRPGAPAIAGAAPVVSGNDKGVSVEVRASADLIGYETSWYAIEPRRDSAGGELVLKSASLQTPEAAAAETAPQIHPFAFTPEMAYFRLFYLARAGEERELLLVAAATLPEMMRKTGRIEAGARDCEGIAACVVAPYGVAFTPYASVSLNGKAYDVAPGASLGSALHEAGIRDAAEVLHTLQVRKPHRRGLAQVTFDRNPEAVLSLPLNGGEEVRW